MSYLLEILGGMTFKLLISSILINCCKATLKGKASAFFKQYLCQNCSKIIQHPSTRNAKLLSKIGYSKIY